MTRLFRIRPRWFDCGKITCTACSLKLPWLMVSTTSWKEFSKIRRETMLRKEKKKRRSDGKWPSQLLPTATQVSLSLSPSSLMLAQSSLFFSGCKENVPSILVWADGLRCVWWWRRIRFRLICFSSIRSSRSFSSFYSKRKATSWYLPTSSL